MDPALQELIRPELDPEETLEVILRIGEERRVPEGVKTIAEFGEIVTCRIRRADIREVYASPLVKSMKAARNFQASTMMPARKLIPRDVSAREATSQPTGRGVVVAVLDWGFDFAHREFRRADGSSRILALWDQRMKYHPDQPNDYGYGKVYTREDIDLALKSKHPYASLGYHPGGKSRLQAPAHATHVAAIAAGTYIGQAPDADLVFVHLSNKDLRPDQHLGDSVRILEALDFVRTIAGDTKLVINQSVGNHGAPKDGSSMVVRGIDAFINDRPATILCQSTGNYYAARAHHKGIVRPGKKRTFTFKVDKADRTDNELEVWYSGRDRFEMLLTHLTTGRSFRLGRVGREEILIGGKVVGRLYHRLNEPNNGKNHFDLFLKRSAPPGAWRVSLFGEQVVDGVYHAYLERSGRCRGCQPRFTAADASQLNTIGSLAAGRNSLVVGAYTNTAFGPRPSAYSSAGPTIDGRPKPDLSAPGDNILSAHSTPGSRQRPWQRYIQQSGTSMAAPFVAGTCARVLEILPGNISFYRIRKILLGATTPLPSGFDPRRGGAGLVNPSRAVELARRLTEISKNQETKAMSASHQYPMNSEVAFSPMHPFNYSYPKARFPFRTPPTPVAVTPATQWPSSTNDPDAVIRTALGALGFSAAQLSTFERNNGFNGLRPIARIFGPAFQELLTRLRYTTRQLRQPPHNYSNLRDFNSRNPGTAVRHREELLPARVLLAIPGHFRQLARQTTDEGEAFITEVMGWLVASALRDSVNTATSLSWWLPPVPIFTAGLPVTLPAGMGLSTQALQLANTLGLRSASNNALTLANSFYNWRNTEPGHQWRAETGQHSGLLGGKPFYPFASAPAAINAAAARLSIQRVWTDRLAQTDRSHPIPSGSTQAQVQAIQTRRRQSLTRCDNTRIRHLSLISNISLQGLNLAYHFPITTTYTGRVISRLNLLTQLHPTLRALFNDIYSRGWNDLLFQTSGAGCFRGIKKPSSTPHARRYSASRVISNHSYGMAMDFNVVENPNGSTHETFCPRIVAAMEHYGFTWGKSFRTPDPHHFEYR